MEDFRIVEGTSKNCVRNEVCTLERYTLRIYSFKYSEPSYCCPGHLTPDCYLDCIPGWIASRSLIYDTIPSLSGKPMQGKTRLMTHPEKSWVDSSTVSAPLLTFTKRYNWVDKKAKWGPPSMYGLCITFERQAIPALFMRTSIRPNNEIRPLLPLTAPEMLLWSSRSKKNGWTVDGST